MCSSDLPSKTDLLENIEGKVLDLQSQLRTVREERESGIAPPQVAPLSFGGRGGRGRGRGRSQLQSGGYYPHYAGRGEPPVVVEATLKMMMVKVVEEEVEVDLGVEVQQLGRGEGGGKLVSQP